jgi:hypothetical protein
VVPTTIPRTRSSAAEAVVNRHAVTIAATADVENKRMVFPLFERAARGNPGWSDVPAAR